MKNLMVEQDEQARRMAAIGRLAGGVAHDFNNILTVILGYSEMILASPSASEKVRQDAQAVLDATARATSLTRQLLHFSRRQEGKPQTINVSDVLLSLEPRLRRLIPESIALRVAGPSDSLFVHMDPGQLDQILDNLAAHARDAMPDGGVLSIGVRQADVVAADQTVAPGSYVLVELTDTGIGMDDQSRERVFEPFFTTRAKGAGAVFGLATVYAIVTHSDGYITVSSAPGKGSVFSVYLPLARAPEDVQVLVSTSST